MGVIGRHAPETSELWEAMAAAVAAAVVAAAVATWVAKPVGVHTYHEGDTASPGKDVSAGAVCKGSIKPAPSAV